MSASTAITTMLTAAEIEAFLHRQVHCWNAGDKPGFFAAYRSVAPNGLQIEYVGRPPGDGWPVLEQMWTQQSAKIEIEELLLVINGTEAACHALNKMRGTTLAIHTLELYAFEAGRLSVRYFIQPPSSSASTGAAKY